MLYHFQWEVQPLADNLHTDTEEYVVTIETGLKRGAGTTSNVWCVLYGTKTNTGVRSMEGQRRMVGTFLKNILCSY